MEKIDEGKDFRKFAPKKAAETTDQDMNHKEPKVCCAIL